jgi:galactokinase
MDPEVDPNRSRADAVKTLRSAFREAFDRSDVAVIARAPGRVNLIGDHTDYNDGFVLPMTIDRAIYACAAPRSDGMVRLYSANYRDHFEYALDQRGDGGVAERRDDLVLGESPTAPAHSWRSYVTGAIEELRVRGLLPGGFDLLILGDVPLGAGLSSSAALTVSTVLGLQELFAFDLDPVDAIRLCQLVEHRYAGVPCGIMDQFASRLGRRDHALFLDCRSLEHEHVPLPLADARTRAHHHQQRIFEGPGTF